MFLEDGLITGTQQFDCKSSYFLAWLTSLLAGVSRNPIKGIGVKPLFFTGDIIVLHGARQVGKTSLLHYFEAELKAKGKSTAFLLSWKPLQMVVDSSDH